MSREAMQMALEALESVTGNFTRTPSTLRDSEVRGEAHKAITVLRQALVDADDTSQERVDEKEKREQEPVAHIDHRIHGWPDCFVIRADPPHTSPLYLSLPKREWVGLTDEEKSDLWCESTGRDWVNEDTHVFADAIEAKLREKNT